MHDFGDGSGYMYAYAVRHVAAARLRRLCLAFSELAL
jgi:hypothetical protein